MSSCGEKLVSLLEAYGVDTVFGIPGNHTVQLYRGLSDSSIRHVTPRHEQGAAFMADGYARASGKPGVCFLISGPGLTNAATAMMQALADSVPMLVVTAVAARKDLGMGEGRLHELPDQRGLATQVCRFSHTLMRPEELPKVLARAFAVFDSARPGPVHIELPLDVITADASTVMDLPWVRTSVPAPAPNTIYEAVQRIDAAEKPLLLLGGGAVKASEDALALAEKVGMPVLNTVNGKGIVPISHPLAVGSSPSLGAVRAALKSADLVLAVGTEFGETDYDMLFLGDAELTGTLIRIDIDPAQLTRNQRSDIAIVGDASLSLRALYSAVSASPRTDAAARAEAMVAAVREDDYYQPEFAALFHAIQSSLPDLCLVGDSTLPTYYAVWQYETEQARSYFHSATGAGTLGFALPAALGAKLARPERPVAALIGDGSIQFTLSELAAGVEAELPVAVLVWNNQGYGEIKNGMQAAGVTPTGVDIYTPDIVATALGLGCAARKVSNLQELSAALVTSQRENRPSVIELRQEDFIQLPAGQWYE